MKSIQITSFVFLLYRPT